jgi:hypothetical protein
VNDIIAADFGIRQLHARFGEAVWRKDAAAFGACYAVQADWKIAGLHITGRDDIAATFARLLGACEKVRLIVGFPQLELTDTGANGRIETTELAKMGDGSFAMTLGIYHDRYVLEDGLWRFAARHFELAYRGPADLSADFVQQSDFGLFPNMPPVDAPTLTRRFAD